MGLDILRERLRLGEERLAIDRIAASLGFECACNARRADQRRRAAQRQNETEISHDQSPRIARSIESSLQAWIVNAKPGGGKVYTPESLGFSHAANGLFDVARHGYHRHSANDGGIRCDSATIPAPGVNYSPIEKVACGGPGPRCPWGRTWVCGPLWLRVCSLRRPVIGTAPGGIAASSAI